MQRELAAAVAAENGATGGLAHSTTVGVDDVPGFAEDDTVAEANVDVVLAIDDVALVVVGVLDTVTVQTELQ